MSSALPDERPVAALLSSLIDAAHLTHVDTSTSQRRRQQQQPQTTDYTLFKWQVQEAAEASKSMPSSAHRSSPLPRTMHAYSSAGGHAVGSSSRVRRDSGGASLVSFCMDEGGLPTPNLEVTCEYDANFQSADLCGTEGTDVRPSVQPSLGPIAYLFRWYTKRATQFPPGFPSAEDLTDAPAMLPPDPFKPASTPSMGVHNNSGAPSAASSAAKPPRSGETSSSSPTPAGAWSDGLPSRGGHTMNRAPDPVMSTPELCAMLEDLGLVPQLVSRQDVTDAFRVVMQIKCDPPNRLPCGQVRPDEIRFPQFCDALIRLALAAEARSAAAAGAKPGAAEAAVASLMQLLGATSPNLSALKRKLDALARMAADRGAQRKALKWMYVAPKSAMDAARAGLGPLHGGWTVDSPCRAPEALHDTLMTYDRAACTRYIPDWRKFPDPALNLGAVLCGETRCLRMLLRNRSAQTMYLRIDTSSADGWLTCAFKELPLPSGVPRVLDVQAQFNSPGEYTGSLQIYSRVKSEAAQCVNAVPFYALVPGPEPGARAPQTRAERGAFAAKGLGAEVPSAQAISVALSVSNSPSTSYAGSMYRSTPPMAAGANLRLGPDTRASSSSLGSGLGRQDSQESPTHPTGDGVRPTSGSRFGRDSPSNPMALAPGQETTSGGLSGSGPPGGLGSGPLQWNPATGGGGGGARALAAPRAYSAGGLGMASLQLGMGAGTGVGVGAGASKRLAGGVPAARPQGHS